MLILNIPILTLTDLIVATQLLGIICGLGYLHRQRVIHGDLKGVRMVFFLSQKRRTALINWFRFSFLQYNIVINALGSPCLADFGLTSVAGDRCSVSGSNVASGGSGPPQSSWV